jgi:PAS domain-containing protein
MPGYPLFSLLLLLVLPHKMARADALLQHFEQSLRTMLATLLIVIAGLAIAGFILKRRHSRQLDALVQAKTAELEAELQHCEQLELHAKRESDRLQTLLDHTLDSVITIDATGTIQHFNKASTALYGY